MTWFDEHREAIYRENWVFISRGQKEIFVTTEKWDRRYMELAEHVAGWSKDRSTKCGAVLVSPEGDPLGWSYNGFPRTVDDNVEERHERPDKYLWTSHAEENAVCNAARIGVSLRGTSMYCTHPPCARCARQIIQAGIVKVCTRPVSQEFLDRWGEEAAVSKKMFFEAQVQVWVIGKA
jgi:dCMP deaminase